MNFEAVIFDLDGTLFDSMGVWEQIDIDFLAKRGYTATPEYVNTISGFSFMETAVYTIEKFCLPEKPEEIIREWNEMAVHAYGSKIQLKPYAKEYLLKLKNKGIQMGIATSLPALLYKPALINHKIEHLFGAVSSAEEVKRDKNHPDIFLYTAAKMKVKPENCLVFEDIPQAVKSAKSAGMWVYAILDDASKNNWKEIGKMADGVLVDFRNAPMPK